jgi:hypothetical protein
LNREPTKISRKGRHMAGYCHSSRTGNGTSSSPFSLVPQVCRAPVPPLRELYLSRILHRTLPNLPYKASLGPPTPKPNPVAQSRLSSNGSFSAAYLFTCLALELVPYRPSAHHTSTHPQPTSPPLRFRVTPRSLATAGRDPLTDKRETKLSLLQDRLSTSSSTCPPPITALKPLGA